MAVSVLSSIDVSGFHRTITTSIIVPENADWIQLLEESRCSLQLHYKFPVLVFVDPYELVHYHNFYTFQHHGYANLELPVTAMGSNGTSLLLTLTSVGPQDVKVPVHLRYGEISHSNSETHRTAEIAWPDFFLSCSSSVLKAESFLVSYDSLPGEFASSFEGCSLYVPLQILKADANSSAQFMVVAAPVGQFADLADVWFGTVFTIVAMFLYVAYVSYVTARRLGKRTKAE
ncbi:PIG-X [Lentinula aciculospora]|uniref:Protein PBN1 n=1 Tax=Lentinula aciculospora TaxID=153920 RepID=A0A9W9DRB3_9AGAR|nr:PIG-X [Lentinula aciculospora]